MSASIKLHKKSIATESSGLLWDNPDGMSGTEASRLSVSAELVVTIKDPNAAARAVKEWEALVGAFLQSLGAEEEEAFAAGEAVTQNGDSEV